MNATPRAFGYLFALALMWGSSYAFIKLMVETIPPLTGTLLRMVLGFAILATVMVMVGGKLPRDRRSWIVLFVIGIVGAAAPFTLIAFATERIPASSAAILMASAPTITMILAHFATQDDRLSVNKVAGLIIGFLGIAVLFGSAAVSGIGASVWGMLAVIGAASMYASTNVLARTLRGVTPTESGVAAFGGAILVLLPAAFVFEEPLALLRETTVSTSSWIAVLYLAIFSSAIANVVFYRLVNLAGSSFSAFNNYLSPPIGVLWGMVLLGEEISWNAGLALLLILLGIAVANYRSLRAIFRPARAAAE